MTLGRYRGSAMKGTADRLGPWQAQAVSLRRSACITRVAVLIATSVLCLVTSATPIGCRKPEGVVAQGVFRLTAPTKGKEFDDISTSCWSHDSRTLFYTRARWPTGSEVRAAEIGDRTDLVFGAGHSPAAARTSARVAYFSRSVHVRICMWQPVLRKLLSLEGFYTHPSWSYDDEWLACFGVEHEELVIFGARDGTRRWSDGQLAETRTMTPAMAWSPVNSAIAYVCRRQQNGTAAVVRVFDAVRRTSLTLGKALADTPIAWIGGAQVAYAQAEHGPSVWADIVCRDVASRTTIATGVRVERTAKFELAGSALAHLLAVAGQVQAPRTEESRPSAHGPDLHVFDLARRELISLGGGVYPAWACKRAALAFVRLDAAGGIYVAEAPAWEPRRIAAAADARDLVWSPDDRYIAFVRTNAPTEAPPNLSRIYSQIWVIAVPDTKRFTAARPD